MGSQYSIAKRRNTSSSNDHCRKLLRRNIYGKISTEKADIKTVKIHTTHIISSPGAKCCALDIHNMYLNTVLPTLKYTRIHVSMIPDDIRTEYGINDDYVDNKGFVYFEITKAIYGLIQFGALAHADLKQHLAKCDYFFHKRTHGLWYHKTRKTTFTLVVDDFQVSYFSQHDADHLITVLEHKYKIKTDWKGEKYIGIDFKWDYNKEEVILSMKWYVERALKELKFIQTKTKPTYGPTMYTPPEYSKKI